MNDARRQAVDQLERKLSNPIFLLRMNRDTPTGNSSERADKARKELHDIVVAYAKDYLPVVGYND